MPYPTLYASSYDMFENKPQDDTERDATSNAIPAKIVLNFFMICLFYLLANLEIKLIDKSLGCCIDYHRLLQILRHFISRNYECRQKDLERNRD